MSNYFVVKNKIIIFAYLKHTVMDEVYEKLKAKLQSMTQEQLDEEWEALKEYNEIGPFVSDYLSYYGIESYSPVLSKMIFGSDIHSNDKYSQTDIILAA